MPEKEILRLEKKIHVLLEKIVALFDLNNFGVDIFGSNNPFVESGEKDIELTLSGLIGFMRKKVFFCIYCIFLISTVNIYFIFFLFLFSQMALS